MLDNCFLISSLNSRSSFWAVSFWGSLFAPLWGVGYVLPFLGVLAFLSVRQFSLSRQALLRSFRQTMPLQGFFVIFVIMVLFSSLYHPESKWGSAEGFWVVLSSLLFFFFGNITGITVEIEQMLKFGKTIVSLAFLLMIVTILGFKKFNGGVWGEMNVLTAAVLMVSGALSGLFLSEFRKGKDVGRLMVLFLFLFFSFYFALKISTSDASLILLTALFFLWSIIVPDRSVFLAVWSVFLISIIAGVMYMVFNEPLDFEALLSTKKLESFLSFRPQGWLASLSLLRDNPWTGIGSGLYRQFYEALLPLLPGRRVILSHSHCLFFVHFVAHGTFTGLAFITLIMLNLRQIFSSLAEREVVPFALMAAGIWYFTLTYGLVELSPASRELVPLVWGSSGLLVGLTSKRKSASNNACWKCIV